MFSVFRQPYAVLEPAPAQIRSAVVTGLFIGLFLLIFQPFGLSQWMTEYKWLKLLGFGLITFIFTAIHFTLWPALFPHFFAEQQWTVGRAVLFILANILFIGIGNFLYLGFLLEFPFRWSSLAWMVIVTLVLGLFPATGTVLFGYIRRLREYRDSAATMHPLPTPHPESTTGERPASPSINSPSENSAEKLDTPVANNPQIALVADNEKDTLTLAPTDLLYIESSDNYCTVYYLLNGKLQKPLLRSSLSRIETQLTDFPRLVRCHRSFVVNLDRVERITGNAQGYKLHLMNGELDVPVARRYNETLVASLRAV